MNVVMRATAGTGVLIALGIGASGCAWQGGTREALTVDEARAEAVTTLRAVTALHDGWPGVPRPAANDCVINREKAVEFTYFVVMDRPDDPKGLVTAAADHWRAAGYTVDEFHEYVNKEAGTIWTANAHARGRPHPSISATNIAAGIYVDARCVLADPDDYR